MPEQEQFQFNPERTLWRVSGERMILLAGSSALHKQIAYPPVAEALKHTGELESNPVNRLRTNAESGFDLIFGTTDDVTRITDRINNIHRDPDLKLRISETTGAFKEGTPFSPRTQEGLGLVGATLIEGSVEGYETFVDDLSDTEKDDYTKEALELFRFMGLKEESLPSTYDGIRTHIEQMVEDEKLSVGQIATELAPYTMLAHSPLPRFIKDAMRLFTRDLLPENLRNQFGYTLSPGERNTARRRAADIKKAVAYLPYRVRYNPQFRRATNLLEEGVVYSG